MTDTAWDEPEGGTPRGTLVVLPGRGETPASYARFGRRISADAWRVRLVPVDLQDLDAVRAHVEKVLADETLPSPRVLVGSDSGATLAALWADSLDVDGVVLAGLALGSSETGSWEEEVEARSACPVHRRVLDSDGSFERGALSRPLPFDVSALTPSGRPTLLLHGAADTVTPARDAVEACSGPSVRVRLVAGGRHDVLNDATHRAVAATVVLWLESLRLGPDLPAIVLEGDAA